MITSDKLISNISYTNKDFNTIYPALLDLVKKITYRWDPSISNESDPGVILLKLNALIADKCNYNIDKNVLECFPLSVTQDRNARQLYAQLGYFMHWRIAAETTITMRWVGATSANTYTIPKFTMVADADDSIVYTLIGDTVLPLDGSYKQFDAMQGIATEYRINGSNLITSENLDSNNRLYFDYNDVAENGIFITNEGVSNYSEWIRVDNLLVEEVSSSSRYYSFGVTQDTNVCYIEFPENAPEIIGGGINITYLKTDGGFGNVAPFTIDKFYGNVSVEYDGNQIALDSSNVQIINYVPGVGGEDPETIDSAYTNYKRTIGTFDTLVTLRDYINAVINYSNVSNAIVCDRTNDIQCCYDILSVVNGVNQPVTAIEEVGGGPAVEPFDLKFYMLFDQSESVQDITSADMYNDTFRLLDDVDLDRLDDNSNSITHYVDNAFDYLNDLKHISQDFYSVGAYTIENNVRVYKYANKICFIKNYYPVSGTIIPQYKLPTEQKEEVRKNVRLALFEALNAQQVEFGQEIDYDLVYDTIVNADERIKSVRLNDLVYQTYAVYMWVNSSNLPVFKEVRIDIEDDRADDSDGFSYLATSQAIRLEIAAKSVLAGMTPLCVADDDISPQMGQQYQSIGGNYLVDTQTISTGLDKAFTHTTESSTEVYTYEVEENESVSIFAPNLIDTDEYTSYVRYEYYLLDNGGTPKEINSNTSYKLLQGEYIALYWSADIDSGYNYVIYGKDQIIKASFPINSGGEDTLPLELKTRLGSNQKISGVSYEIPNLDEHIASLPANDVLSSTKTVIAQSTNNVDLTHAGNYCSWILNSVDEAKEYVLFEENQASYQLKSGEYFLYTNNTRTSLVVLGAGTLLSRDVSEWSEKWACASYQYSSIISEGMDVLVNTPSALQQVKEDCTLSVIEQQFITLNKGASLRLISDTAISPYIISPDPNGGYLIPPFTRIEYKGKDESDYHSVSSVDVNGGTWKLLSQLNINCSKDNPQKLIEGQSFILNNDSNLKIEPDSSTPIIYVSSSFPIAVEGGQNVNVTHYDEEEVLQIPKISAFVLTDSTDEIAYTSEGLTAIKLTDGSAEELDINFPDGEYIIMLQHGTEGLTSLTVTYEYGTSSTVALHRYGNSSDFDFSAPRAHYIYLKIDNTNNTAPQKIKVMETGATECMTIIQECLKYSEYDSVSGITSADLVQKVQQLNQDYLFDFTYQVDPDEIIKDPLNNMAFFEPTHPYNKCTIGQLDTTSLGNVYISEKTRS